jgi:hypothetical protein
MNRILAAFMALMFTLALSQPADARLKGLENAKVLNSVTAVGLEVYTFDQRGRYVEIDFRVEPLSRPESEKELRDQLYWLEGSHARLKTNGRIYVEARLFDYDGNTVYESVNSFLPERVKRKGKVTYRTPQWGTGDLYFEAVDWDDDDYNYTYDDPKTKAVKPWSLDIYFDWVQVEGIEQVNPDLHTFVTVLSLAPEWDYHPAIETIVHKSGEIKFFARSQSGFKPAWVRVTSYVDISDLEPVRVNLPYTDRMSVWSDAGNLIVTEFVFDQDPVDDSTNQGGGGKG